MAPLAGVVVIEGGPGTGKTRTLTTRIAHQVTERGVPAQPLTQAEMAARLGTVREMVDPDGSVNEDHSKASTGGAGSVLSIFLKTATEEHIVKGAVCKALGLEQEDAERKDGRRDERHIEWR